MEDVHRGQRIPMHGDRVVMMEGRRAARAAAEAVTLKSGG